MNVGCLRTYVIVLLIRQAIDRLVIRLAELRELRTACYN